MPLAAASSADLRMARLVWAVTVAGRKLGAAEDDVAGVTGLAGANLFAGAVVVAGALGVAWEDLWCVVDSCLLVAFLATVDAASTFFLVEDDVFFTAASAVLVGVDEAFLTSLVGADLVLAATFSVVVLGLVVDEGLILVLLLTFALEEAGVAEL